ncbi:hypothetical protein KGF57_002998 [Candida theae]|uniref:Zn(2)-C6 fungal-type domain-containing protein n=1 Tax=Candida theae TaxID=1198502 RepID=A0AAD5BDT9_9ASCO|nr:uncharacterized protein KGF57_002998 [Candida theae]KAI5957732.1 hypothetical protein KGF57_002998 [Candida theae]
MFSIFDATSFANINRKHTPPETPLATLTSETAVADVTTTITSMNDANANAYTKGSKSSKITSTPGVSRHSDFKQKQVKQHNIIGTRFRSKTGCLNCRKRKKKCDETSPVCLACQVRNQECIWPDLSKKTGSKRAPKQSGSATKRALTAKSSAYSTTQSTASDSLKSLPTTPSGAASLSLSTKSPTPISSSASRTNLVTDPAWKYDTSLLSFDPALLITTLPISSTRDEIEGATFEKSRVQMLSQTVQSVSAGLVDFDNEHEDAMDDVGHLNMNVLLT